MYETTISLWMEEWVGFCVFFFFFPGDIARYIARLCDGSVLAVPVGRTVSAKCSTWYHAYLCRCSP